MRWEYHPPFTDRLNNIAVVKPDVYTVVDGTLVHGAVVVPDKGYSLTHPLFAASIAPTPILTASQAGIPQQLHRSQKTNFAPRIGFAWRPTGDGKNVIRGGYGRFIETMLGTLTSAGWGISASNVGKFTNSIVNGQPALTFPYPYPDYLGTTRHAGHPRVRGGQLSRSDRPAVEPHDRTGPWLQHGPAVVLRRQPRFEARLHGKPRADSDEYDRICRRRKSLSPFPLFSRISHETTGARSNYHALTIAANKRMSKGLQFAANYVFAKNLSMARALIPRPSLHRPADS
jgi:hypothetical protein